MHTYVHIHDVLMGTRYTYTTYKHTYIICTHSQRTYTCTHTHTHTHTHTRTHARTLHCTHIHTHYTHILNHTTRVHLHTYTHTHTHTRSHTYTHAYSTHTHAVLLIDNIARRSQFNCELWASSSKLFSRMLIFLY